MTSNCYYQINVDKDLQRMPLPNGFIDRHQLVTEWLEVLLEVHPALFMNKQTQTDVCIVAPCTEVHYGNGSTDRNKLKIQEVKLKCPLTSLQPDHLLSRSKTLPALLNLEKKRVIGIINTHK